MLELLNLIWRIILSSYIVKFSWYHLEWKVDLVYLFYVWSWSSVSQIGKSIFYVCLNSKL